LVFTSCTASKDDSAQIAAKDIAIGPNRYLTDRNLRDLLLTTREQVLSDPRAKRGNHLTYAFDLYVKAERSQMYSDLRARSQLCENVKQALRKGEIQWFFLSGGYGMLHALEPATKYQATFSYGIARQNGIPYTARVWRRCLVDVCEHVMNRYSAWPVYAFGSRDYTDVLQRTRRWRAGEGIKIIESTGTGGGWRLSPIVAEFVRSLMSCQLSDFDRRHPGALVKLPR